MDIITFYNELASFDRHISKHNIPIISGDLNAHATKTEIFGRLLPQELVSMPKYYIPQKRKKGGKTTQITLKHS